MKADELVSISKSPYEKEGPFAIKLQSGFEAKFCIQFQDILRKFVTSRDKNRLPLFLRHFLLAQLLNPQSLWWYLLWIYLPLNFLGHIVCPYVKSYVAFVFLILLSLNSFFHVFNSGISNTFHGFYTLSWKPSLTIWRDGRVPPSWSILRISCGTLADVTICMFCVYLHASLQLMLSGFTWFLRFVSRLSALHNQNSLGRFYKLVLEWDNFQQGFFELLLCGL